MYTKLIEQKIVRITYELSFGTGTRVVDILDNLKEVPLGCKLIDVENNYEDGTTCLYFREEKDVTSEGELDTKLTKGSQP